MVRRNNVGEGAEKPFSFNEKMRLPKIRGGTLIDYFEKYPNASGIKGE